jgi:hypothetical protein
VNREDLQSALGAVLEKQSTIELAYVFGSVARGDPDETSDVDVAVLADRELDLGELSLLAEELGRALDFDRRVDLVDLRAASPTLVHEVVRDGIRLVVRSDEVRFDFEVAAIRRFEDTKPLRRAQQDLLREVARGRP